MSYCREDNIDIIGSLRLATELHMHVSTLNNSMVLVTGIFLMLILIMIMKRVHALFIIIINLNVLTLLLFLEQKIYI